FSPTTAVSTASRSSRRPAPPPPKGSDSFHPCARSLPFAIGAMVRWFSLQVGGVEVVVDGEAADAHRLGDGLDRATQLECTPIVQHLHRRLLVLAGERVERPAKLLLHRCDHALERALHPRGTHAADELARPLQRDVPRWHPWCHH